MNNQPLTEQDAPLIHATIGPDGLYRDKDGCVYGLVRMLWSRDKSTRAGVGLFSLGPNNVLSKAAKAHDYAYECPAYQLFHYRADADELFLESVKLISDGSDHDKFWFEVAKDALRWFSEGYWNNDATVLKPTKLRFPDMEGMFEQE